jgi:MYXO-CTERM domain-containing protein
VDALLLSCPSQVPNSSGYATVRPDSTWGMTETCYARDAVAAALAVADTDDGPASTVLIPRARWVYPDNSGSGEVGDNGEGFYAAHLLNLVAWERRGWARNAADTGTPGFYGTDTTEPQKPTSVSCAATNGAGSLRVSWPPVGVDVLGRAEAGVSYRVYWGTAERPDAALKPGTGGFDYAHRNDTGLTYLDLPSLPGTATHFFAVVAVDGSGNVSEYSPKATGCVPEYTPVARIACTPNPPTGPATLAVSCHGDGTGGSTDANGAGDITSYVFSLDGTAQAAGATFSQSFASDGSHTLSLRVTDSTSRTATASVPIIVGNPPIARITTTPDPASGQAALTVAFDGSGSTPGNGANTLSYAWDFKDGGTAATATASHTFATAGDYAVSLVVTESGSGLTGTAIVNVHVIGNSPPDVSTASASPLTGAAPLNVHFDASGVADPDGNTVTLTWDFGDGSPVSHEASVDHEYAAVATYHPRLTATDDAPSPATATKDFTIDVGRENRPPDCSAATVTPSAGAPPLTVRLDASGCTDPDGNTVHIAWHVPTSSTTEDVFTEATREVVLMREGITRIRLSAQDDAAVPLEIAREFPVNVNAAGAELVGRCGCSSVEAAPMAGMLLVAALALRRRR